MRGVGPGQQMRVHRAGPEMPVQRNAERREFLVVPGQRRFEVDKATLAHRGQHRRGGPARSR